ncbi:hypothetical protein EVAR_33008_1 [Eumeta japonica]|uniref:Uncharacterized protein n=1 Tax=Eumeta variegata TaxID=151549 RepID=A0A4C1VRI8_EUMVA|nr:hypothetical protein EVAR_33008_1 [Eumeta japonica]
MTSERDITCGPAAGSDHKGSDDGAGTLTLELRNGTMCSSRLWTCSNCLEMYCSRDWMHQKDLCELREEEWFIFNTLLTINNNIKTPPKIESTMKAAAIEETDQAVEITKDGKELITATADACLSNHSHQNNYSSLAVRAAVRFQRAQNCFFTEKVKNLHKDIMNIPKHVCGDYSDYEDYYCSVEKKLEIDNEPNVRELIASLMANASALAYHAQNLIHTINNNRAEQLNSVIAKYVEGVSPDAVFSDGIIVIKSTFGLNPEDAIKQKR